MVLHIWVCLGYVLSNNHKLYFRETVEETPAAVFYVVIGVKCIMLVILANVAFLSKRTVQQMKKDEAQKLDDISAKEKMLHPLDAYDKKPKSPVSTSHPSAYKDENDTRHYDEENKSDTSSNTSSESSRSSGTSSSSSSHSQKKKPIIKSI